MLLAVADDARRLGAQFHQPFDRLAGLTAAARLAVSPEQNEFGDDGAGFEIKMLATCKHPPQAVEQGGQCAERDQGIHVGCKVASLVQHSAVKACSEAENYGGAEDPLYPDARVSSEICPRQFNI